MVRHAVYFGVCSIESAYQLLDHAFDPDTEGFDSRPAGSSACAALLVDNLGFASLETLVVSGCAWAVGAVDRCRTREELLALAWIRGYQRSADDLAELFSSQLSRAASEAGSDSGDVPLTTELTLWLDEEFCESRSALFVAALRLHYHFMRFCSEELRAGLFAAADILSGKTPATVPRHKALAAWQTLFLFVPVVSTTFASFDRMFVHLGREDLGWLLIDEAGQAAPQAAAGAIWRARRTVVVGDPQQLEPVVTIPLHLQNAIRNTFGVSEKWLPATSSAQSLADVANPWGTMLAVGSSTLWVGSPLRIHRRCDSPMFQISNAIAYDDMMLSAVAGREELDLPPSMWLDAPGQARGHLAPEQMERLSRILDDLVEKRGCDPTQIFVISPFRVVAQSISRICQPRGISGGTVHTAQGQEADIVIIVLGGDPAKPGAKAWASRKPNLLNVAVSRAKRRLYVIGDRESWREFQYFNTLADGLRSN